MVAHMRTWTPEEDITLLDSIKALGPRWRVIAKRLPGRTEAMCRNRHQRIENGKKAHAESGARGRVRNRCTACGQPKRGHTCMAKLEVEFDPELRSKLESAGRTTHARTAEPSAAPPTPFARPLNTSFFAALETREGEGETDAAAEEAAADPDATPRSDASAAPPTPPSLLRGRSAQLSFGLLSAGLLGSQGTMGSSFFNDLALPANAASSPWVADDAALSRYPSASSPPRVKREFSMSWLSSEAWPKTNSFNALTDELGLGCASSASPEPKAAAEAEQEQILPPPAA